VDADTFTIVEEHFKQTLSARKLMATIFSGRKGVLMLEIMQKGTTIISEVYCVQKN
jgi:hypothetical protein